LLVRRWGTEEFLPSFFSPSLPPLFLSCNFNKEVGEKARNTETPGRKEAQVVE
jgi:hypothetical protein